MKHILIAIFVSMSAFQVFAQDSVQLDRIERSLINLHRKVDMLLAGGGGGGVLPPPTIVKSEVDMKVFESMAENYRGRYGYYPDGDNIVLFLNESRTKLSEKCAVLQREANLSCSQRASEIYRGRFGYNPDAAWNLKFVEACRSITYSCQPL